jgi:hypothetical protein
MCEILRMDHCHAAERSSKSRLWTVSINKELAENHNGEK